MDAEADTNYYQGEKAKHFADVASIPDKDDLILFILDNPSLSQANILDAGCGEGSGLRYLRKLSKGVLYGVDASSDLLKIAQESQQGQDPASAIIYKKLDLIKESICSVLNVSEGYFDIAISKWVICYAATVAELRQMVNNIAKTIKTGGKFYGITFNPALKPEDFPKFLKFHYRHFVADDTKERLENGDKLLFTVFDKITGEKTLEVPFYYYDRETLEAVFKEAGFEIIKMGTRDQLLQDSDFFDDALHFDLTKL